MTIELMPSEEKAIEFLNSLLEIVWKRQHTAIPEMIQKFNAFNLSFHYDVNCEAEFSVIGNMMGFLDFVTLQGKEIYSQTWDTLSETICATITKIRKGENPAQSIIDADIKTLNACLRLCRTQHPESARTVLNMLHNVKSVSGSEHELEVSKQIAGMIVVLFPCSIEAPWKNLGDAIGELINSIRHHK